MAARVGSQAGRDFWGHSDILIRPFHPGRLRPMTKSKSAPKKSTDPWRRPMDLTPKLAGRLLHGLAENHRQRLALLVRKGGRASMVELLGVTNDSDLRVLSYFQGALSRKIRRLVARQDKRLHLIGWDYDSTKWNDDHTSIVDGDCYITDASLSALRKVLGKSAGLYGG